MRLIVLVLALVLAGCGVGPRQEWYFLLPGTDGYVIAGPFMSQGDCDDVKGALPKPFLQRLSSRCWRGR